MQEVSALPGPSGSALAKPNPNPAADATLLAERIVRHLFNYLSSFVGGNPNAMAPDMMIPMGMVAKWYENFMGKVRNSGIGFLERQE